MMEISGTTPLWLASRALLTERGGDFFRRWEKALKTFDAEDIHDLRVASRRLREGLTLLGPCFPKKSISSITGRVKKLTSLLGTMRNTDEALAFFSPLVGVVPPIVTGELQKLLDDLGRERKKERTRLERGLSTMKPDVQRALFTRTCNRPLIFLTNGVDPFSPFSTYAGEKIAERAAVLAELLPAALDAGNVTAQHRLRIAVKRFRYRLEIISPVMGNGSSDLLGTAKSYQEVLGRMHDLDVFAQMIEARDMSAAAAGPLQETIRERRTNLYNEFLQMQNVAPLDLLGVRARSLL